MRLFFKKEVAFFAKTLIVSMLLSMSHVSFAFDKDKTESQEPEKIEQKISSDDAIRRFKAVFKLVESNYVTEPDRQKMLDGALSGMLHSLDPHSAYMSDKTLDYFKEQVTRKFGGIGIEITNELDVLKVISPIDGTPAARAGIMAGDYIVAVDDEQVSELGYMKSVEKMRGEPGTKVNLSIVREGEGMLQMELVREIIKSSPVKTHIHNGIAYMRIASFSDEVSEDMIKAMHDLQKTGEIKGFIIDVRNNPGGILKQAIAVSQYFIDSGVIVSVRGRMKDISSVSMADTHSEKGPKVPMVVLVNTGSASASEIFAGAMQDHHRAVILGTKTYGKGSVQTVYDIDDRSAVSLTMAKFYTPSDHEIQLDGITPDIVVEPATVKYGAKSDYRKVTEASFKNSIPNAQKAKNKSKDKDDTVVGMKNSVDIEKKSHKLKENESSKKDSEQDDEAKNKESVKPIANTYEDMYGRDYQYARAYDLVTGMIKVSQIQSK